MSKEKGGGKEVKTSCGFVLVHPIYNLEVEVPAVSCFLGRPWQHLLHGQQRKLTLIEMAPQLP